jgi:hypothetical protein
MGMTFVPSLQLIVFPFSFHGFLIGNTVHIIYSERNTAS